MANRKVAAFVGHSHRVRHTLTFAFPIFDLREKRRDLLAVGLRQRGKNLFTCGIGLPRLFRRRLPPLPERIGLLMKRGQLFVYRRVVLVHLTALFGRGGLHFAPLGGREDG